jgi:uncharacterized Tic20 family protein
MASDGYTHRPTSIHDVPPRPLDPVGDDDVHRDGPASDERILALLCHLGGLFTGFVMPLVLWLVKKAESPFVDHHGKEALNFQIFLMLPVFLLLGAGGVVMVAAVLGALDTMTAILGGVVCTLVFAVLALYETVITIIASVAAYRGQSFRYPLTLRFIR